MATKSIARKPVSRAVGRRKLSTIPPSLPLARQSRSAQSAIAAIRKGYRFEVWENLRLATGLSQERLARITGIDPSTLRRRKRSGRLDPRESERVERVARIYDMAVRLFGGNADVAREWLNTPDSWLRGATPLDHSETELGAREVEDLIGRIEHGAVA